MVARTRTREDWLRAARLALLHRGPHGVRIEPLARALGVTKGSFYWHFKDRRELLEALLREWEEEAGILTDALRTADPVRALPAIVEELGRRNLASERGESPSDAAIFSWAALDAHVAKRTERSEHQRMQLFRKLTGRRDLADLFYYAYHGFLLRRRRVPAAAGDWAALSRLALRAFAPKAKARSRRWPPQRLASLAGVALLAGLLHGCTTMRIVRHRDPSADRPRAIFPQRIVHRADQPTAWVVAPPQHVNFDTVTVRDVDLTMRSMGNGGVAVNDFASEPTPRLRDAWRDGRGRRLEAFRHAAKEVRLVDCTHASRPLAGRTLTACFSGTAAPERSAPIILAR